MTAPFPGEAVRPAEAATPALEWSFNPWRERPGASSLAAVLAFGLCVALWSLGEAPLITGALSAAAIASFSPLLSPARCRVNGVGAARGGPFGWDRRAWGDVRRAVLRPAAVMLSPYAVRHWLDPYRALWLPFPARDRERLTAALRPVLERHGL